jgi:hypothetical protein
MCPDRYPTGLNSHSFLLAAAQASCFHFFSFDYWLFVRFSRVFSRVLSPFVLFCILSSFPGNLLFLLCSFQFFFFLINCLTIRIYFGMLLNNA